MSELKLTIDSESVNIYLENGEERDPTHVVYWNADEWEEDPSIVPAIMNAVDMFHSDPDELLNRLSSNYPVDSFERQVYKKVFTNYGELDFGIQLDNLDWTKELGLNGEVLMVKNEHGTWFPFSDLSEAEIDIARIELGL